MILARFDFGADASERQAMDFLQHVALAPLLGVGPGEMAAEDRAAGFQSRQRRINLRALHTQSSRDFRHRHRTGGL